MNQKIIDSVDKIMRNVYEMESNRTWSVVNGVIWTRPYLGIYGMEILLVTVVLHDDNKYILHVFKQISEYEVIA